MPLTRFVSALPPPPCPLQLVLLSSLSAHQPADVGVAGQGSVTLLLPLLPVTLLVGAVSRSGPAWGFG